MPHCDVEACSNRLRIPNQVFRNHRLRQCHRPKYPYRGY